MSVPRLERSGVELECTDFRGQAVRTVQMANLGDVGRAWLVSRIPLIAVDPHIMRTLPPKLQLFFYFHECAHHVLAHSYALVSTMESDADCWAIKTGRERALFTRDEVVNFAPWLMKSTGSPCGVHPGEAYSPHGMPTAPECASPETSLQSPSFRARRPRRRSARVTSSPALTSRRRRSYAPRIQMRICRSVTASIEGRPWAVGLRRRGRWLGR